MEKSNKLQYICEIIKNNMKPSEARKAIEKQIADLEVEKYCKIHEIWEIEAKIARKKETLTKFPKNELGRNDQRVLP